MLRSKLLAAAAIALPMIAGATSAQANIIALNIDVSGSMGQAGFDLQRDGYVAALTSLLPTGGENTIGVWKFSTNVTQVFALTTIDTVAKKNALIAAIQGMTYDAAQTAIAASVITATAAISGFAGSNCVGNPGKCIIDVSTDGGENMGGNPTTASSAANTAGIKVNCLGVGGSADCTWNGTGTDYTASNFAAFQLAITQKLTAELTKAPEPLTMSLFGAGLVGAAALRRRKAKTA